MFLQKPHFKEIYESVNFVDNKQFLIKIVRLFIRYTTRVFGYMASYKILGSILFVFKFDTELLTLKYVFYIICINKLRLEYLSKLSQNDLIGAILKKNEWAELSAKNSLSAASRMSAKRYLSLLSKYGFYKATFNKCNYDIKGKTQKIFYIYGPNAKDKPSKKYEKCILVTMKPINLEETYYKENILFMNSEFYNKRVSDNAKLKNKLIKKYDEIYVSCRQAKLSAPFKKSKFPLGDSLASPMALGRVLYNLTQKYGKFECIIEGFDFYVGPESYKPYYPTLNYKKGNSIDNQKIYTSLADHDALYNFLFVKEIISKLDILDSSEFKRIIQLRGGDYLNELSRNFKI
ncbi:hypothetical protein OAD94_07125 [Amylibacter sp.]|nr:hypothetical protein [Amylibacter sp.]